MIPPWQANIVGFILAFMFSFFGHYYFSFQYNLAEKYQAMLRFSLVALLGFFMNETGLIVLMGMGLHYKIALGACLISIPWITFLCARFWAFA